MNKYIDYIGTETEYSDGTKAFAEKSDGIEVNICEKDGYTTAQEKSLLKKRIRKLWNMLISKAPFLMLAVQTCPPYGEKKGGYMYLIILKS